MIVPRETIELLSYRGKPVGGALAVDFREGAPRGDRGCGLFIHGRDFSAEVAFQFFNTRVLSCNDLIFWPSMRRYRLDTALVWMDMSVANEEMAMLPGMSRTTQEKKSREDLEVHTAECPAKYHEGSGKGPSQSQSSP